jgi:hypothetical protein
MGCFPLVQYFAIYSRSYVVVLILEDVREHSIGRFKMP